MIRAVYVIVSSTVNGDGEEVHPHGGVVVFEDEQDAMDYLELCADDPGTTTLYRTVVHPRISPWHYSDRTATSV